MRLPLIAPAELSAEQRPVYDDMKDRHREELSGLQDHRRQRRADGAMEPMAARAEIRQADLGPDPGDVGVAVAAGPGQGSWRSWSPARPSISGTSFMPMSSPRSAAVCPMTSSPPSCPASGRPI